MVVVHGTGNLQPAVANATWPVTLAILVFAFGSLVAAGLPLRLTILGLMASAGTLFLAAQAFDVSIWSMNFALMFALALGIDYALFIVARFRGAHFGSHLTTQEAVAVTMDTAGKAVLVSGVTVLISLSAVMLVPSPAFRSMSLGIMLSVLFVLAAALTLLPALLAKLGNRVDALTLRWVLVNTAHPPSPAGGAPLATSVALRDGLGRDPRRPRSARPRPRHRHALSSAATCWAEGSRTHRHWPVTRPRRLLRRSFRRRQPHGGGRCDGQSTRRSPQRSWPRTLPGRA